MGSQEQRFGLDLFCQLLGPVVAVEVQCELDAITRYHGQTVIGNAISDMIAERGLSAPGAYRLLAVVYARYDEARAAVNGIGISWPT